MKMTPGCLKSSTFTIILVLSLACGEAGRTAESGGGVLPPEKLGATFSDADVFGLRTFAEPLVPTSATGKAEEDAALGTAVNAYLASGSMESLDGFLTAWPDSRWAAALEYNLGLLRYTAGYFTRAEAHWKRAWELARGGNEQEVRALANQALAQMVRLQSRLGQKDELKPLLSGAESREIGGSARQMIDAARGTLYGLEHRSADNSKSSLSALGEVRSALNIPQAFAPQIATVPSSPQGISLAQVSKLASVLKMPNQMVRLAQGGDIPVPSIMHMKLGHYAAIVGKSDQGFQVHDAALGFDNTISADAILTEGSGYFLVPAAKVPKGFEDVSEDEGEGVYGSGDAETQQDGSYRASDAFAVKGPNFPGLASYAVHAMMVSLHVEATPMENTVIFGPEVSPQVTYNERDTTQSANLNVTNFGRQWTMNWTSSLRVEGTNTARVLLRGGGFEDYPIGLAAPNFQSGVLRPRLTRKSATQWDREQLNGTRETYTALVPPGQNGTGTYYLTQVSDLFGNAVKLEYDSSYRLSGLRDGLGRMTTFTYGSEGKLERYRVTKITDPNGRTASFTYNAAGQLASVTSIDGRESKFAYATGDVLNGLENSFGKTTFARELKGDNRWIEATDPLGGLQRVEYNAENSSVPGSDAKPPASLVTVGQKKKPVEFLVDNSSLNLRNTFAWDKPQMEAQPRDYASATVYHWLQGREDAGVTTPVASSIKSPLENRVWFNYPEQTSATQEGAAPAASKVARVLEAGDTQLWQYAKSTSTLSAPPVGRPTPKPKPTPTPDPGPKEKEVLLPLFTDPVGRSTQLVLTFTVTKTTAVLHIIEQRRKTKSGYDLLWRRTYDAANKKMADTDAAGGTTSYSLSESGVNNIVTKIDPLNQKTIYSYAGTCLQRVDPPLGGPIEYTYQTGGGIKTITRAGYTLTYSRDDWKHEARTIYPDGTFELVSSGELMGVRVDRMQDREGKAYEQTFDANGRLIKIVDPLQHVTRWEYSSGGNTVKRTDPLGHVTTYEYDYLKRETSRTFADGTKLTFNYAKDASLASTTDAAGQTRKYTYAKDGLPVRIDYSGGKVATPPVTWTWDNVYPRINQMMDGIGGTGSKYTYVPAKTNGAGSLATVDGPLAGDLMAFTYDALGRTIKRTINGGDNLQETTFDAIGRVTRAHTNMGTFDYHYNDHGLLDSAKYPGGQEINYTYFDAKGDFRLQTLSHHFGGTDLLTESYTYSPVGNLLTRQSQGTGETADTFTYSYDGGDQLTKVAAQSDAKNYPITYSYDADSNMLTTAWPGQTRTFTYNDVNARTGASGGTQEFDANGNLTKSPTFTATWDAENRPVSMDFGKGQRVEYSYDGLGRRVRIRQVQDGVRQVEYRYVWDGLEICEQRNEGAPEIARSGYFPQGESKYVAGAYADLFYVKDWQGSVRKAVLGSGFVDAKASYLPFGTHPDLPLKTPADTEADFGYTGLFVCPGTGLPLAPYRVLGYAAWLSRNPLGEIPGMNIYSYAMNNPLAVTDGLGLFPSASRYFIGATDGRENLPHLSGGPAPDLLKQLGRDGNAGGFGFAPWRKADTASPDSIVLGSRGELLGAPGNETYFENASRYSPELPGFFAPHAAPWAEAGVNSMFQRGQP